MRDVILVLMENLVPQEKKSLVLVLVKQKHNFVCLSLFYNGDNSYLFVHGKELYNFKANSGNVN